MSETVTIYMPVYNGELFIENAINSILKQSYQNIKILISNNHSADTTIAIIEKYLDDKRIELNNQPHNLGMLGNGDYCLSRIHTKYFMGLNHDDFFHDENALKEALEIIENDENIAAVYCNMFFVDERGKKILENKYYFDGLTSGDIVAKKSIINCRNLYSIPLLIRTSAIKGFRYTDSFYHTSDVDFAISISKGKQIYYIPKPLLALRFHANNSTARDYLSFIDEFKRLAQKHNINLTKSELLQMNMNHLTTVFKKKLFYFYLDNIRR
jgi:glycosyltransferase involved in cell wall biosynthesis